MEYKGRIFGTQFRGDYWKVVNETKDKILIEATYFSGRPKKCHEIHKKENKVCPFPECDYKLNQFCLSKNYITQRDRGREVSVLKFELSEMQDKVCYADWTKHTAGESVPITKHRV